MFLHSLYDPEGAINSCTDFKTLFDLCILGDKFDIPRIVTAAKKKIESVKIAADKVIEVLEVTEAYKKLLNFGELCGNVRRKCALAFLGKYPGTRDATHFLGKHMDKPSLVATLMREVGEAAPPIAVKKVNLLPPKVNLILLVTRTIYVYRIEAGKTSSNMM